MDTQMYYATLRAQRETLAKAHPSGYLLVVSLDDPQRNVTPGAVCEVSVGDAARLLIDRTHRVATPDEVNAYQNRQGVEQSRIRRDDLDRVREQFKHIMGATRA
jgi:hypothetical protein